MMFEETRRGRREMLSGLSDAVEVNDFSGLALAGMRVMTSVMLKPGTILVNREKQTAFVHELDLIALKCGSDLEMRQAMVADYFVARAHRDLDRVLDLLDQKMYLEDMASEAASWGQP